MSRVTNALHYRSKVFSRHRSWKFDWHMWTCGKAGGLLSLSRNWSGICFVAAINTTVKNNLRGNCLFPHTFLGHNRSVRKVLGKKKLNKEQRQESWRKITYQLFSLTLLIQLSYTIHDPLPRDGITHSELGPPIPISTLEKSSQATMTKPIPQRDMSSDNSGLSQVD